MGRKTPKLIPCHEVIDSGDNCFRGDNLGERFTCDIGQAYFVTVAEESTSRVQALENGIQGFVRASSGDAIGFLEQGRFGNFLSAFPLGNLDAGGELWLNHVKT